MGRVTVRLKGGLLQDIMRGEKGLNMVYEFENGASLASLFKGLAERHDFFRQTIFDPVNRKMRQEFFVLVNGKMSAFYQGLETRLQDGDMIELLTPVIGG